MSAWKYAWYFPPPRAEEGGEKALKLLSLQSQRRLSQKATAAAMQGSIAIFHEPRGLTAQEGSRECVSQER